MQNFKNNIENTQIDQSNRIELRNDSQINVLFSPQLHLSSSLQPCLEG